MPRLSPFSGKRPEALTEEKTLTDAVSGNADTFFLQYLDEPLSNRASDELTRLVGEYLGYPENGISPKQDFPPVDGVYVLLSQTLLATVATIYVMQTSVSSGMGVPLRPDGAAIYTPEELVALAVTEESLWDQLKKLVDDLNNRGNQRKNGVRASGIAGSPTPSAGSSPTPKLSPAKTLSSAESTNDSASSVDISQEQSPATT